jgi:hypothetical protein
MHSKKPNREEALAWIAQRKPAPASVLAWDDNDHPEDDEAVEGAVRFRRLDSLRIAAAAVSAAAATTNNLLMVCSAHARSVVIDRSRIPSAQALPPQPEAVIRVTEVRSAPVPAVLNVA